MLTDNFSIAAQKSCTEYLKGVPKREIPSNIPPTIQTKMHRGTVLVFVLQDFALRPKILQ